MNITTQSLKAFRSEFQAAVATLAAKHNVTIALGNITYADNNFSSKLTVTNKVTKDGGSVKQAEWNKECRLLDLTPEHFGQVVKLNNGKSAKITAINLKKHKFPIIVTLLDGSASYGMTVAGIKKQLPTVIKPTFDGHAIAVLDKIVSTGQLPKVKVSEMSEAIASSIGLITKHNEGDSRQLQVAHYQKLGLTSSSEIAKLLGTNASYIARLMK